MQNPQDDAMERIRQRQAQARSERMAEVARERNPQGVSLQGESLAFRDTEPPEERVGLGRMLLHNLNPIEIAKGIGRGAVGAVDELGDFATSVVGGAAKITGIGEAFGGEDFLDWWAQDDDDRNALHIGKDIIAAPTSILGGLTEGIVQIGIGMVGVGKFAAAAKLGKVVKLGKTGQFAARGAAADAIFFDAHEKRIANLLDNSPDWFGKSAVDFLAANENDSEAEGRFKNALEGLMLGGVIDSALWGLKVYRKGAKGAKGEAIKLAEEFEPTPSREVVKLPGGQYRLAREGGEDFLDDAMLKEIRHDDPALKGLDVVDDGTDGVRTFGFTAKTGDDWRVTARMTDDVLHVEAMGKWIPSPSGGGRIDLTGSNIGDVGVQDMSVIGVELAAEFPTATHIKFTKINAAQGKAAKTVTKELDKFRQELFASEGDAAAEALSMAEGRASREIAADGFSKESDAAAAELGRAYETNRSTKLIKNAEQAWIRANRTNIGAGKADITKQIVALARHLTPALRGGARNVMARQAKDALSLIKGDSMEGLVSDIAFDGVDELAARRAAGLILQSLGEDVARYSIRMNVGKSNLAYVQMARAMDQMMHVEEILTGKAAVFVDRSKKFFDAGHQKNTDVQGAHAAQDAPPEPSLQKQMVHDLEEAAGEGGPGKPGSEQPPLEGEAPPAAPKADATDDAGRPEADKIPAAAFKKIRAGVAPGPRSVRNLSKKEIQDLGRFVALADGDPRAILISVKASRLIANARRMAPGLKSNLIRWRLSAMLSGVGTQAVNTVSNFAQALLMPSELMIGGALRADPKAMREGNKAFMSLFGELRDSWTAARKSWKMKAGALDAQYMTREIDPGRFTGMLAIANVPMDFLTSSDEFFKVMNYRARIRSKSYASSVAAGLDPAAAASRMVDDLEASMAPDGRGLNADALEYSRTATFTNELTGSAKRVAGALQNQDDAMGFVGQLFVPFIRTPHNVMMNIVHRTPGLQLMTKTLREDLAAGGSRAASATGKMVTAGALAGSAVLLAHSGRITGGGPQHPLVRRRWLDAGFVPYTVKMPTPDGGEVLINYNRLSSLFGPMAMIADVLQASGDIRNGETAVQAVSGVAASMMNYVGDNSWIGNAGEMMETMFNGDAHAMQNFVEKVGIGMVMPEAISQLTAWDDTMREADGFIQNLMNETPGLSQKLPPRRNIFREPVMKAAGSFDRAFNPFTQVGPTDDNELAFSLFRLGRQMALPPNLRFDGRMDLKDNDKYGIGSDTSPYEYYLDKTAKPSNATPTLKSALRKLIRSSTWSNMPEGSEDWPGGPRYEAAARIIKTYQDIANAHMLRKYPKVFKATIQEQTLKTIGRFGGRPATDRLQETFNRTNQ